MDHQEHAESTNEPPAFDSSIAPSTDRLSLDFSTRLYAVGLCSFFAGALIGGGHGGRTAALRFRAENSHRMPKSQKAWFFYHKAKHNVTILASMKEGTKFGFRLIPWTLLFFSVEEIIDRRRARDDKYTKDFLSTTVAGLTVAGIFSIKNRMPLPTAARMAKVGLAGGLSLGVLQDVTHCLRGRPPSYVTWALRQFGYTAVAGTDKQ